MILDQATTLLSEANQFVTGPSQSGGQSELVSLVDRTSRILKEAIGDTGNVLKTSEYVERDGRDFIFAINVMEEKLLELLRDCFAAGYADAAKRVLNLVLWLARVNVAIQENWPWRNEHDITTSRAECLAGKSVDVRDVIATLQS